MHYQSCTLDELVDHFLHCSTQAITQQIIRYQASGNEEMVCKIKKARILAKQRKLAAKLESL